MSEDTPFLRNLWYVAGLSHSLAPQTMRREMMLGEPVLLARKGNGEAFALRDVCPHRASPLSPGRLVGGEVECPYHGWRFRDDGVCSHIPSVVQDQTMEPANIRVANYPLREQDGLIWVYMPASAKSVPEFPPPPMPIESMDTHAVPRFIESQTFACGLDHAVVGLMDPAHGPFVHRSWWWRTEKSIHEKAKHHAPSERGFTMMNHKPSSNSFFYKILGGDLRTEIRFELPGLRFERIRAGRYEVLGFTAVTPKTAEETLVTQVFYWSMPWLSFAKPFLRPFAREFLSQDRRMVEMQKEGLKYSGAQMLIQDADVPAIWYHRLKKAWADSVTNGTAFANPVQARTLRWRS